MYEKVNTRIFNTFPFIEPYSFSKVRESTNNEHIALHYSLNLPNICEFQSFATAYLTPLFFWDVTSRHVPDDRRPLLNAWLKLKLIRATRLVRTRSFFKCFYLSSAVSWNYKDMINKGTNNVNFRIPILAIDSSKITEAR
jgi:hypothetical protein